MPLSRSVSSLQKSADPVVVRAHRRGDDVGRPGPRTARGPGSGRSPIPRRRRSRSRRGTRRGRRRRGAPRRRPPRCAARRRSFTKRSPVWMPRNDIVFLPSTYHQSPSASDTTRGAARSPSSGTAVPEIGRLDDVRVRRDHPLLTDPIVRGAVDHHRFIPIARTSSSEPAAARRW